MKTRGHKYPSLTPPPKLSVDSPINANDDVDAFNDEPVSPSPHLDGAAASSPTSTNSVVASPPSNEEFADNDDGTSIEDQYYNEDVSPRVPSDADKQDGDDDLGGGDDDDDVSDDHKAPWFQQLEVEADVDSLFPADDVKEMQESTLTADEIRDNTTFDHHLMNVINYPTSLTPDELVVLSKMEVDTLAECSDKPSGEDALALTAIARVYDEFAMDHDDWPVYELLSTPQKTLLIQICVESYQLGRLRATLSKELKSVSSTAPWFQVASVKLHNHFNELRGDLPTPIKSNIQEKVRSLAGHNEILEVPRPPSKPRDSKFYSFQFVRATSVSTIANKHEVPPNGSCGYHAVTEAIIKLSEVSEHSRQVLSNENILQRVSMGGIQGMKNLRSDLFFFVKSILHQLADNARKPPSLTGGILAGIIFTSLKTAKGTAVYMMQSLTILKVYGIVKSSQS